MMLSRRMVPWAIGLAAFASLSSYGIAHDPDAYGTPIFETVRLLAPLWVWALVWGAIAVMSAVAAVTRRVVAWRIATIAAIHAALIWLLGITWEHFVDGERLSLTGWGLWLWFAFTNFRVAVSRHQFERGCRGGKHVG